LLIAQRKTAQIIGCGLRLAACCEECTLVGLQEIKPGLKVACMP
jgi:hypothetical protein